MSIRAGSIAALLLALSLVACRGSAFAPPAAAVPSPIAIEASATPSPAAATTPRPSATTTPNPSATPRPTPSLTPRPTPKREPTCPYRTPPPFATPKSTVVSDPLPYDLDALIAALPAVLRRYPDDLGALYAVLADWGALDGPEPLCQVDLDDDGVPEVVLLLVSTMCGPGLSYHALAVLKRSGPGYVLSDSFTCGPQIFDPRVAFVGDLTGDGRTELVFVLRTKAVHSPRTKVYVFAFRGGQLLALSPSPIMMVMALPGFEDRNGDGRLEITLHGGMFESFGVGPAQTRTEVYAWDGQGFELIATEYDPSPTRVYVIFDGDSALRKGDLTTAIARYSLAATDPNLLQLAPKEREEIERTNLEAFAYYRLVTAHALVGDRQAAAEDLEALRTRYADHIFRALAEQFWEAWQAKGSVAAGCDAATAFARAHGAEVLGSIGDPADWEVHPYWDGIPEYTLDDICFVD